MEYRYFEVGRLFRLVNPKGKITSKQLLDGNDINYIAAKKTNNGVAKRCSQENIPDDQIMKGNCIVFIQQGDGSAGYTTYQPEEFYATSCVCCGYIDGILNEEVGLYLVSMLDMNRKYYSHSYGWNTERLTKTKILLPTLTNPDNTPVIDPEHKYHPEGYIPDWEYMQDYIKELEQDYIKELEQYLIATGLNDYELTDEDREVLGDKETKEFALENFFHKIETEKIIGKANDFPTERSEIFNLPLLTAGINNQGLARYAKRDDCPTIIKNAISVSANGANSGASFYQPDDFSVLQDSYALKVNGYEIKNQEIGLYLTTALNKAIADNHDWNNKAGWNKIKKDKISLPIQLSADNSPVIDPAYQYHPEGYVPDWEYMEKYIKAIEKLVIEDVVKYKNKMIEKMKGMVD